MVRVMSTFTTTMGRVIDLITEANRLIQHDTQEVNAVLLERLNKDGLNTATDDLDLMITDENLDEIDRTNRLVTDLLGVLKNHSKMYDEKVSVKKEQA